MKKIAALIRSIFNKPTEHPTTTQMAMGLETGQINGLRLIKKIPFFGNMSFKTQYKFLSIILIPTIIASITAAGVGLTLSDYNTKRVDRSTNISMLIQRSARLASEAAISGNKDAFKALNESRSKIDTYVDDLLMGTDGLTPTSGQAVPLLEDLKTDWTAYNKEINVLINSGTYIRNLHDSSTFIIDAMSVSEYLLEKLRVLSIQKRLPVGSTYLIDSLASAMSNIINTATTLNNTISIKDDDFITLVSSNKTARDAIILLENGSDVDNIKAVTDIAVREQLNSIKIIIGSLGDINTMAMSIEQSKAAKEAASRLINTADDFWKKSASLTNLYIDDKIDINFFYMLSIITALISTFIGIFFTWLKLQESQLSAAQIEESIMNLMNDMMDISDGNLALRARVAENITGSIADSLNLTVARLNQTITNVKVTSTTVLNSTLKVNDEAQIILGAVQLQADKIKQASSMVNSISDSVQAVAFAAEQSADVAKEQMDATTEGREAVEEAKLSMLSIRDQIQETAKRIKRLGESAQEIDEIIELISDTTEQTNVLAMNASIQAAAAGEAGRGFRAVATEVQRLAERSDSSLKRIVALIRAIQADTQNAVAAMERSTQQVVNGAQVTEQAGAVFLRIEDVSKQLQELISDISVATQSQSEEAKGITSNMNEILSIADNTATGVGEATSGINNISKLAEDLDESMNQFKLS